MTRNLLRSGLLLLLAAAIGGCGGQGGSDTPNPVGPAPTITSTAPAHATTNVPISRRITATFDREMNPSSFTTTSVRASTPTVELKGTVSYSSNTVTLLLSSPMPKNTVITTLVTASVRDTAGTRLRDDYQWSFKTGSDSDATPPTVSSTDPANGETGVSTGQALTAVFSEPMTAATLNTTTFRLRSAAGAVAGTVALRNNVAVFEPSALLKAQTVYTATITKGARDLSDNTLAADKVWTFTTGLAGNTTAPRVVSTVPAKSATNVPVNQSISITFSDPMIVTTLNSSNMSLVLGKSAVPVTISYADRVAVLKPDAPLAKGSVYSVVVTRGVKNSSGVAMAANYGWTFTTASTGDAVAPTVLSTNPADRATNVFLNKTVSARFSENMRADTLNTATFMIAGVSGTVSYNAGARIATFRPGKDLSPNTKYTASIETGARDLSGNGLKLRKVWTFITGIQRAQQRIDLGAASSYAVLAGSTVTNSGPTIVNGNLGVSPGTSVTGFPPGIVNGSINRGDAVAAKAKADLLKGQLDAAGRLGAATLPGNLSGLTFTPGLYKNSTSVMLSAGNVTLDAQGDPDAVFIFQMGSTLTTSVGTNVILAGGAKVTNVYWSVGTSATLGVNSVFKGIILAEVSITVNTGATSDGTMLTKTGAVTLKSNAISRESKIGG